MIRSASGAPSPRDSLARAGGPPALQRDTELLARVRDRDAHALADLYDAHAAYAMGVALRVLGSRPEAEEVVQDVFWYLWKSRLVYDPARGRFTTWLFTVVRNRAIDRLRSLARRPSSGPLPDGDRELRPLADATGGDPERESAARERQRAVRSALRELSDVQRETLELAFFEGYSHSEIAERRGEPLGTVKSRIKRAMDLLRQRIADAAAEGDPT